MFHIAHDNCFVYSVIIVRERTSGPKLSDNLIGNLMNIWANRTAIPYLNWMAMFKTDDIVWYIK